MIHVLKTNVIKIFMNPSPRFICKRSLPQ